jgi:hypothetical protein
MKQDANKYQISAVNLDHSHLLLKGHIIKHHPFNYSTIL